LASAVELIKCAAELAPAIGLDADAIDAQRTIPVSLIDQLRQAGLVGILRPRRYGGPEHRFETLAEITSVLAYQSGSVGWVYSVTGAHDLLVGLYPDDVQAEYWGSPRPMCASSYLPTGAAAEADGGYVLTGKWSFCSGIDHCDWVMVGAVLKPAGEHTAPDRGFFLLRTADVQLRDDWYTMGLTGTGSKSIEINKLFVPYDRLVREVDTVRGTAPGSRFHENPIYRNSVWPLLRYSIVAPFAGVVRGAFDATVTDYTARATKREPVFEGMNQSAQIALADASAHLEAATAIFSQGLRTVCQAIDAGGPITDSIRVCMRRDQGYIGRLCRSAMESLMTLAGGRGIRHGSKVQRALRDVTAISAHPSANWERAAISFGSFTIGRGPTESF
jgi:alkylation response protein AidB-like acyl-CoA dehydrogenase